MKMNLQKMGWLVCVSMLLVAGTFRSAAGPTALIAGPQKTYTAVVSSVDRNKHTLETRNFLLGKKFNLGVACHYSFLDRDAGSVNDLHSGQKVTVIYQNVDGVLVADKIEQQPMRFVGRVKNIDPTTHTVTVHADRFGSEKQFKFVDDCKVTLRGDKTGTLNDIQPGNYVALVYETPGGLPTLQHISQTSEKYTGTLTAIDVGERTVKAKTMFDTKAFNLGDNCVIVVNGKTDANLSDLKPNDKLTFTFDEINGINVVNRIAPADDNNSSAANSKTAVGS